MTDGGIIPAGLITVAIAAAAASHGDDADALLFARDNPVQRSLVAAWGGLALATGLSEVLIGLQMKLDGEALFYARRRAMPHWIKAQDAALDAVERAMAGAGLARFAKSIEPEAVVAPPPAPAPVKAVPVAIAKPAKPRALKVDLASAAADTGVAPPKAIPVQRTMRRVSPDCAGHSVPVSAMRYAVRPRLPRNAVREITAPRGQVVQIRTLTPAVVGFARRFPLTHWDVEEVAELFGVAADDLASALGVAA